MLAQFLAGRRAVCTTQLVTLRPIERYPRLHRALVHRAFAAEHHIDLERLIDRNRIAAMRRHVVFEPQQNARQQNTAQPHQIGLARAVCLPRLE